MTEPSSDFRMVPLEQLHESPFNPRRHFDDAKMAELVDSVKRLGVLTPLLARIRTGRAVGRAGFVLG